MMETMKIMPILAEALRQFDDDVSYYSFNLTVDDFLEYETPCKMCLVNPCCLRYMVRNTLTKEGYFIITQPCGKFHMFYREEARSHAEQKRVHLKMMDELVKEVK